MTTQFYPGQTLGIIGEGINGPMLVQAARQMGFKVTVYSPDEKSELVHIADNYFVGTYYDWEKLKTFAESCDFITYESQNIQIETLNFLQKYGVLPQGTEALEISMDRLMERALLEENNINVLPYASAIDLNDIVTAAATLGYPIVLKPIQKNINPQLARVIDGPASIGRAAELIDNGTFIVESWLSDMRELSIVAAKGVDGHIEMFPMIENIFDNGKLVESLTAIKVPDEIEFEMQRIVNVVGDALNYRGVYQVDFYLTTTGNLMVKKLVATLSQESAIFGQVTNLSVYEQHIRAIAGIPVSVVTSSAPAILVPFDNLDNAQLQTQWLIKDNWHFTFYHNAGYSLHAVHGHFVATGAELQYLIDQVEATKILLN